MQNKKGVGFLGGLIIIVLILGVGVIYLANSPSPSPVTGSAISGQYQNSDPYYYTNNQDSSCGDYGQSCCSGNACDQGECQGGKCIHCGYMGETCCYNSFDGVECEYGSTCVLGRCKATNDYNYYNECGHVGYPPCQDSYGYYCSYGVLNLQSNICEHCGFLEQPCCQNTDYECDYGVCTYGICKLQQSQNSGSNYQSNDYSNDFPDEYSDTPDEYIDSYYDEGYNSEIPETDSNCGYLNQDCCEGELQEGLFGGIEMGGIRCYDNLECRAGVCVNGPEYESAPRGGW